MNQHAIKQKYKTLIYGISAILLIGLGFGLRGVFTPSAPAAESGEVHDHAMAGDQEEKPTLWTCSMHPEIKLPNPGLCPKCNMALIPLESSDDESDSLRELSVSENAKKLMEIETFPVERRFVESQVRMVGKVDYDETRLKYITAWIPGRLDRLFVDYTGVPVKKGDHMVYLYSPELLSAQEELFQAKKAVNNMRNSDSTLLRDSSAGTLEAAREKLRLWGLTEAQVAEIEQRGTASKHTTIYAPAGGIVIHKNAQEGMYVNTGTRIYTIADLSRVWVRLDAYESDLMWLHYGQEVDFTAESYPGEVFTGTVSFIDPVLTDTTRTVKVRVDVPNPELKLKPGMFVRAVARSRVATAGRVMNPDLAGKWMCPMHPEIIKETADDCDVCGMPLVRTESLGYVGVSFTDADKPLVIPVSAALITGTRAIVYVEIPNSEKPTYEGREIVLGPKAGKFYLVRSGLKEGERVVTKGNFKIDAELQIRAKPSMMTPEGGGGGMHQHGDMAATAQSGESNDMAGMTMTLPYEVRNALQKVQAAADTVTQSLEAHDLPAIRQAFADLEQAVRAVPADLLTGHPAMLWQEYGMLLTNDGVEGKDVETLTDAQRVADSLRGHLQSASTKLGLQRTQSTAMPMTVSTEFHQQLDKMINDYLATQKALAADNTEQAKTAARQTLQSLGDVDMTLLQGEAHIAWMKDAADLKKPLDTINQAQDIETAREGFSLLSEQLAVTAKRFGWTGDESLYQFHCPMAFNNRGAIWLQNSDQTKNPYFGEVMLTCGSVTDVIAGQESELRNQNSED